MTEQVPPAGPDDPDQTVDPAGSEPAGESAEPSTEPSTGPLSTGVSSVDAVLADLREVDHLPLEDHPAAFERAHEALRSALDESPASADDRPDEPA
jgi:hypothetical protein